MWKLAVERNGTKMIKVESFATEKNDKMPRYL